MRTGGDADAALTLSPAARKGSDEEAALRATVDAIEAYEIKRWPLGKEPGGKG